MIHVRAIERELKTFTKWTIPVFHVIVMIDGIPYRIGVIWWGDE